MTTTEQDMLMESNAIEGVTDYDSLAQAVEAWRYLKKQKKLTMNELLKTHKILMRHQPLQPDEKGNFRTVPVYIGGQEAPHHVYIREKLKSWLAKMNEPDGDPIALHVEYEGIHPFVDGNGRTGRMFMNWLALQQGKPLIIFRASERGEYYKLFR